MSHSRTSSAARGYGRDWQRLRLRFLDQHPLCRMCEAQGRIVAATIVDHIEPIAKAPHRRLDWTNLQALDAACHNSLKQQQDKHGYSGDVGADGLPLDENHPWRGGR